MTRVGHLGDVYPQALTATRVLLHHAALLVSAVGRSLAPRSPGFRHAALTWSNRDGGLAGWPTQAPDESTVRAILAFDPPAIHVRREPWPRLATSASIPLTGNSFADVLNGLRDLVTDAGLDATRLVVRTPADLPPGPIDTGAPFAVDAAAARDLGRWFAFADQCLTAMASLHDVSLPVPCWADHFDLAVVVPVRGEGAPPDAQLTLGFSPGDPSIPEPYLYVTPWPPNPSRVAQLTPPAGGRWQTEGWLGLALTANTILAAADRVAAADAFLRQGFAIGADVVRTG